MPTFRVCDECLIVMRSLARAISLALYWAAMRHIFCSAIVIYYPHTNSFAAHKWLIVILDDRNGDDGNDERVIEKLSGKIIIIKMHRT